MKSEASEAAKIRIMIGVCRSTRTGRMAPRHQATAPIRSVAMMPRTTMISPVGSSSVTSLTMASLTTKPEAEARIAAMPRKLSVMIGACGGQGGARA